MVPSPFPPALEVVQCGRSERKMTVGGSRRVSGGCAEGIAFEPLVEEAGEGFPRFAEALPFVKFPLTPL